MSPIARDIRVGLQTVGAVEFTGRVLRGAVDPLFSRSRMAIVEQRTCTTTGAPSPAGVPGAAGAPSPAGAVGAVGPLETFRLSGHADPVEEILTSRLRRHFDMRLAAGRTAVIAVMDGRPVGYAWLSRVCEEAIEGFPLELPDDVLYLWDAFVVRAQRGQGIGKALGLARVRIAHEMGANRVWRTIAPSNRASLRAAAHAGNLTTVGEVRVYRTLGSSRFEVTLGS